MGQNGWEAIFLLEIISGNSEEILSVALLSPACFIVLWVLFFTNYVEWPSEHQCKRRLFKDDNNTHFEGGGGYCSAMLKLSESNY